MALDVRGPGTSTWAVWIRSVFAWGACVALGSPACYTAEAHRPVERITRVGTSYAEKMPASSSVGVQSAQPPSGDAAPKIKPSDSGLRKANLELSLLALLPERWTVVTSTEPPFGYICLFYGARFSPRCEHGEVRLLGSRRLQSTKGQGCSIDAAVYFAPMRAPNIPARDTSGVRTVESDGAVFLYGEADDYVIELQVCPKRRNEAHRYAAEWLQQANELLAL